MPPESKARVPNLHTLDITEVYVRLVDAMSTPMSPVVKVANSLPLAPGETVSLRPVEYAKPESVTYRLDFRPEPHSHDTVAGHKLKPDFYVEVNDRRWYGEIDNGTEHGAALSGQFKAYLNALHSMDGGRFPRVLWITHDPNRAAYLRREADRWREPGLFEVALFDDAPGVILGEQH